MPGLYEAKAADLVKASLTHESKVTVETATGPIELNAENITVTMAEDWAPHVQAQVTAVVPDAATLDRIDPRLNQRVLIEAGYRYPDNSLDLKPLADLLLRGRVTNRPADTFDINADSEEAKLQDYRKLYQNAQPPTTGINEITNYFVIHPGPNPAPIVSDFPAGYGASSLAGMEVAPGDDFWSPLADAAQRVGVWVYCDETRKWRIRARPEIGPVSHTLAVGEDGTIIDSQAMITRAIWANSVIIEYEFEVNEVPQTIYGRAMVSSGPMSPTSAGFVTKHIQRSNRVTQAQANAAASTALKQMVSRGRELTLTAHAAYWLRPGQTIDVKLLTGIIEKQIVKSVTFNLGTGTMTVTTRQPLNVTISTGE